jgi:hypothetical protein
MAALATAAISPAAVDDDGVRRGIPDRICSMSSSARLLFGWSPSPTIAKSRRMSAMGVGLQISQNIEYEFGSTIEGQPRTRDRASDKMRRQAHALELNTIFVV